METVEVVIRIPEKCKEFLDNSGKVDWLDAIPIIDAIANGIVFPKGHGRLLILDEEKVKEHFTNFSFSVQDWISEVGISEATLKIIKADTESEE